MARKANAKPKKRVPKHKKSAIKNHPDTLEYIIRRRRIDAGINQGYVDLFVRIAMMAIITLILLSQVFIITQVHGMSMFPSLKDGDLIIGNRLERNYMQNDVVVYTAEGKKQVGRVVAKTSDIVDMDDSGTLFVNGVPQTGDILYPTYAKDTVTYPLQLGENQVFVLGDYRTQAKDSRDYGAISEKDVDGKVLTMIRRRGL